MSNQLASSSRRSSARPRSTGSPLAIVDQLGAAVDEELDPFRQRVELAQQGDARRQQRGAQRALGGDRARPGPRPRRASAQQRSTASWSMSNSLASKLQEALAPGRVQRQIGAAELGGAGPGRDPAAAAVEAAEHLLPQPRDIVFGQIGRGAPDSTPRADKAISRQAPRRLARVRSKTPSRKPAGARSLIGGSAFGEAGNEAHTEPGAMAPVFSARKRGGQAHRQDPRRPVPGRTGGRRRHATRPPAAAASKAGMPCASRPSTMPASTSPDPAVASSGGAPGVDRGPAIGRGDHGIVAFQQHDRAARLRGAAGALQLAAGAVSSLANSRANSPSCGVNTQGERIAPNRTSAFSAKLVSASASSTVRFPAARIASTLSRVSSPTPAPGPIKRRVAPRIGEKGAELIKRSGRLDDDPGQRGGVDRKRRFRRGHGHQPGAEPSRGAGGEPGRPGHHRAAGNERVTARVFVAFRQRPGKIIAPPIRVIGRGLRPRSGRALCRQCRSARPPSRRNGCAPATTDDLASGEKR